MRPLPDIVRDTERLTLRSLCSADEGEFVRTIHESAETWAPWTPAASPNVTPYDLFRVELERAARGARAGSHLRLGAFDPEGRLVGLFALNEIVRGVFQSAYASWQVRAGRMRSGFGTEAVRALMAIAFQAPPDGLGLHRVQANIMPANTPSICIAEKLGFRREGLAERYLRIAGSWEDHVMFALTRDEWPPSD